MDEDLWRWWEEQDAPDMDDLFPEQRSLTGCQGILLSIILVLLIWGITAAIVMRNGAT